MNLIGRADRGLQFNPFGPNTFTSPEDLMKNLPKAMANMGRAMGGGGIPTESPTFKISMREYEDMAIKVGDKVTIQIRKADSNGALQF
jgi:predicted sugar kinase